MGTSTPVGGAGGVLTDGLSLTATIDHMLTDDLKLRLETRWDRELDNSRRRVRFNGQNGVTNPGNRMSREEDQLVALAELYYEF